MATLGSATEQFAMNLEVRETKKADLPAIFAIREEPLVAANQYRMTASDTIEHWSEQLFGEHDQDPVRYRCSTVWLDDAIAGHVIQLHYSTDEKQVCYCGWNLSPPYWGQGLMGRALGRLFEDFFTSQALDFVIADCFSSNHRCLRLLSKLHFQPMSVSIAERIQIVVSTGCYKWIRRFSLSKQQWQKNNPSSPLSLDSPLTSD